MADETITIALRGGDVSLDMFATAISHWQGLLAALAAEIPGGAAVRWIVSDLEVGSATATVTGEVDAPGDIEVIQKVARAYEVVGTALARGEAVPYSQRVAREATEITSILNEVVESITFETALREAIIRKAPDVARRSSDAAPSAAYGAIEGRIQTLTNRGGLRFTLYDALNDRAVSCYLAEGYEGIMRDLWGRRAIVEGWVRRDPLSGRPLSVRGVTQITPVAEDGGAGFAVARGVVPRGSGPSAEDVIRLLRDA